MLWKIFGSGYFQIVLDLVSGEGSQWESKK
jgi:hypothetical protein